MPDRSGFECLAQIGRALALKAVKAFMLSTSGNSENIERSFGLGADFYAVKPTTFSGLKELLLRYCGQGKRKSAKLKAAGENTQIFCFSRAAIILKNKSRKFKYYEILNHFGAGLLSHGTAGPIAKHFFS